MSLRWTSYVAPKPPKWRSKTAIFRVKFNFTWRKCGTKFLCVNKPTASDKLYKAFTSCPISIRAKMVSMGTSGTTWKFRRNWPSPLKNADFQSIFAHIASAVTLVGMHYTSHFTLSVRWIACVASKSPMGRHKTLCSQFKKIIFDNFETVRDRMSVSINH